MERKVDSTQKNKPIRKCHFKNRRFPVFFMSNSLLMTLVLIFLVSCKSKTDWRVKYNEDKAKKIETTKTTTVQKSTSAPVSIDEYANLLDVSEKALHNTKLYSFITNWYGTPYRFGGQNEKGVDCSGFANILYKEIYNIQLPRASKDIAKNIKRKYTKNLKEGDLVFFTFGKSNEINHVGVYLHNNKFVHASTSKGVIISDLTEPWYGNYLAKCGSYRE